ncbi:MAG: outer membrane beta-barrel protein [Cyclobacteriaceae bacterium]|nr:outer membrane beta-barrel protein [Cyclobacteriaceae bacterium]
MKPNAALIVLILLSSYGYGQTEASLSRSKTFVGFYFSGNQSWMTINGGNNSSAVFSKEAGFGFNTGFTLIHELSSRFSIESSLGYVRETNQNSFQWVSVSGDPNAVVSYSDWRNSFTWLELPVIVNFTLWRKGTQSLFVGGGLSTRRLLSSVLEISTLMGNGFMVASSRTDMVNEWNFFPTVQAGAHFNISDQSRLTVAVSYQRSITKLFKTTNAPTGAVSQYGDADFTQNALNLTVAYTVNWDSLRNRQ